MNRPGIPLRARTRLPRFRAENFSTCTRSPTARGSSHASHSPWDDVAFSSTEGDRHLGIRPVSQLNTWPVVSPVNASRRPSRNAPHHSGSGGWLDLPRGGLSPPILCQLPGALRVGSKSEMLIPSGCLPRWPRQQTCGDCAVMTISCRQADLGRLIRVSRG
jgi:hypothetical protein